MQPDISDISLAKIVEIRMKDLGETKEEAERLVRWLDANVNQDTMRKNFKKIIEDGTIF